MIRYVVAAATFALLALQTPTANAQSEWVDLLAGNDLPQWETWLRARESEGGEKGEPLGLNNDPDKVFTMADGVLRVSGEVFGCISSKEKFRDYQIQWKFRWGEKKWPPRVHQLRDSGFLYHCYGPHGKFWNAWKACVEYQIQEGDVGDLIFLSGPRGKTYLEKDYPGEGTGLYDPLGDYRDAPRTRHSGKHESPHGEWNTCQAIVRGDSAVHIVNGHVVNRVKELWAWQEGEKRALDEGYLQFQSEAAELFYKDMLVRDLPKFENAAENGGAAISTLVSVEPTSTELSCGDAGQQLHYENKGDTPAHVVAVELLGATANDWKLQLPELPMDLAPGKQLTIGVRHAGKNQSPADDSAAVELRLEGLDGPANTSRVKIKRG